MEYQAYMEQTYLTASYPGAGTYNGLNYVRLGLVGETGEVAEVLKKLIRDGGTIASKRDALTKEIGDVCWYFSEGARCLGLTYDTLPHRSSRLKSKEEAIVDLASAAARFAVATHKMDVSRPASFDTHRRAAGVALSDVVVAIGLLCRALDIDPFEVLRVNVEKLTRRQLEGKISGSGSDR